MPYSYDVAVASGATAVFGVPFPYLQQEHVHVAVDGVPIPDNQLVWLSANSIQLPSNPAAGAKVRRQRNTPAQTSPVSFSPGFVNAADLNAYVRHMLYVVQEAFDAAGEGYQITEQILSYLDSLGGTLDDIEAAKDATLAANIEVQAAKELVIQLRDEVQAVVDLAALGVAMDPEDWITATNVQAGFAQVAAAITALDGRVEDLETITENLPTTLDAKLDKAGGSITGDLSVGDDFTVAGDSELANLTVLNSPPRMSLDRPSGQRYNQTVDADGNFLITKRDGTVVLKLTPAGALELLSFGDLSTRINTQAASYASAAQSAAISSAATTALGYANARVSQIALGGSWSSGLGTGLVTAPAGGVMTGYANTGSPDTSYGTGRYLYYYLPNTGWVAAGNI